MDAFMNEVKQLFEAQDRLREFGASVNQTRKPLRVRERELSQSVTEYMRANRIDACDYRGEKLVLKLAERGPPITPGAVREAVHSCSGDAALADRCVAALASRAPRQTVTLRRVKGKRPRAPRARRPPAAAASSGIGSASTTMPAALPAPVIYATAGDSAPPALSEYSDDDQ